MLFGLTDDQTLADFDVVQPGVTLNDATDLGTVGPQIQTASGVLDLTAGQENVALYKVTLGFRTPVAPGHRAGRAANRQRLAGSAQPV